MERVTGIGGIFFKARDPKKLIEWYARHLGLLPEADHDSVSFNWPAGGESAQPGTTVWAPFPEDGTYFDPSTKPFMVNFRVADLDALLEMPRQEGGRCGRACRRVRIRTLRLDHGPGGQPDRTLGTALIRRVRPPIVR